MRLSARRLLFAYVLLNAVLSSVLLPLWEGFDEPFHFGYVQQIANLQALPDARTARLSAEVGASILLAPASPVVKQNLPRVMTYDAYFSLPAAKRAELRNRLFHIPTELRRDPSEFLNYEAHQPPLAHMLAALPERLLARAPLPVRVALLRILLALAGSLFLLAGAERLLLQLGLSARYRAAALFCLFSCQMTWATLAHIGNDWLAVPLAVWTLVALNRYDARPGVRTVSFAAVVLAAGLLTKAYFIAFVPLTAGVCALRKHWRDLFLASVIVCGLAGPWYLRNFAKYGVLTGTQESRGGVALHAVLTAAPALNWAVAISSTARRALWTGNNSFLAFSANTLNLLIAVGLAALAFWTAGRHKRVEWIVFSYCVSFALALAYAAVASHIYTRGAATGPSPWYAQILAAPLLALMFLGASRHARPASIWLQRPRTLRVARHPAGRRANLRKVRPGVIAAACLVALFGYVAAATYPVKLIPLYGGYRGRTSFGALVPLYIHRMSELSANLDAVALAPGVVIFVLAGLVTLLAFIQAAILILTMAEASEAPAPNRH